jgi:hypothetical protein
MSTWGWIIMALSVGSVTALFAWCIWKVMTLPGQTDQLHGFEIETPDERAAREAQD